MSSSGQTCLAAVFIAPGEPLQLREFAVPVPSAEEAVVRIECCTLCGSDLHTIRGARSETTPSILGHEILGVVDRVGDPPPACLDGRTLQAGDRVTWSVVVACGRCDRCEAGLPQKCRQLFKYGHAKAEGPLALSGGLAETILLRKGAAIVRVPRAVSDEAGCPANCATATAAAAIRSAGPLAERRVLILGAGMLGLTASAWARSQSAAEVVVCDVDPQRLQLAERFGATRSLDWDAAGRTADESPAPDFAESLDGAFDTIFEMSGAAAAVEAACLAGDVGARIVLVGSVLPGRDVRLDPERIVRRLHSVRGVHNYVPADLQAAVAFLSSHSEFPFAELVEASFPLREVNEAVELAVSRRPVRVAVRP